MNPLLLAIAANTIPSGYTGETITTPGAGTWVPPAEIIGQDITVQCWGAGSEGTNNGGGGGEFAQANFTVTGDVNYMVADVGTLRTRWDESGGGSPVAFSSMGQTGGSGGMGDVTYDGGDGGNSSDGAGGGGGAAAGTDTAGSDGSNAGRGFGGPGGTGVSGGGSGGAGGDNTPTDGQNGQVPGGGGGGADNGGTPGIGAPGQIRIIFPSL